jgi:hypothetical protein
VLVVAPAALLHSHVPQPAGSLVYALLTGHPEREAGELVFMADLTWELRAWPQDTWGQARRRSPARRPGGHWLLAGRRGDRLQVDDLGFEEARSLHRPAMTYVRGQRRGRLTTPDWSRPPALAASHQRPRTRRPAPVTTARPDGHPTRPSVVSGG